MWIVPTKCGKNVGDKKNRFQGNDERRRTNSGWFIKNTYHFCDKWYKSVGKEKIGPYSSSQMERRVGYIYLRFNASPMRIPDRLNDSEFVYAFGDELIYMTFIVQLGASDCRSRNPDWTCVFHLQKCRVQFQIASFPVTFRCYILRIERHTKPFRGNYNINRDAAGRSHCQYTFEHRIYWFY